MEFKRDQNSKRVIDDLKKRTKTTIGFNIVLALTLLVTGGYFINHPKATLFFFTTILVICLFRRAHHNLLKETDEAYDPSDIAVFKAGIVLTGLVWGIAVAYFMGFETEHESHLLMTACAVGLSAGGVVAITPDFTLTVLYIISTLLPTVINLLLLKIHPPVAICFSMFGIYLFIMAQRGNKEYWDALKNEELLEKKSKDLEKKSWFDVLTGLHNRRFFDEQFAFEFNRAVRNRSMITIVICDIDNFKRINDTYGHLAGDEYLKKTAGMLNNTFKRGTDIIARFGGEEFVVLMPQVDSENAFTLTERFRKGLENMVLDYSGKQITTTISSGIASLIPSQNDEQQILISMADQALYMAKHQGRNKTLSTDEY